MAARLLSHIINHNSSVPHHYIRPISDRPNLAQLHYTDSAISSIDLQSLQGPHRTLILHKIAQVCQKDGFFRVVNHGIPEGVIENMMQVSRDFFGLPESEKMKSFSDDPSKTMRLSTSFNMKRESVHNWRDYLRLHCYPLQDFIDEWPSNPTSFRGCVGEYCTMVISNGRYKSARHRAVVNSEKVRISIPTFYCPSHDAVISPAEKLLDKDHPPIYRSYPYSEYYHKFWETGLEVENCLDCFAVSN
ncbi:hypothetical protein AMTR_s00001p00272230 [Amborella trichopoda]|uniref:Non-haem dioxygenase N-terminal domain-containing protein n=1 Tax=Amborella trichopoda TaxID=13333 RepID=W1NMW3_AMBTC|nr:hypothetical protein AMTR_s00001p00272230 [Amborella trichopoda]